MCFNPKIVRHLGMFFFLFMGEKGGGGRLSPAVFFLFDSHVWEGDDGG